MDCTNYVPEVDYAGCINPDRAGCSRSCRRADDDRIGTGLYTKVVTFGADAVKGVGFTPCKSSRKHFVVVSFVSSLFVVCLYS